MLPVNRRHALGFGAMSCLLSLPRMAMAGEAFATPTPSLEFAFEAFVTLAPPLEAGTVHEARKRLIPITGGHVSGPSVKGEVVPGGGDWQAIEQDGFTDIHARYTLRTQDGVLIFVDNPGIRRGPPAVMARLAAGEVVDPALYYFRTTPRFDVADGKYQWLRENLFICSGARRANDVSIAFYRVL